MKKSKNNRYYCHRRLRNGKLIVRSRTIEIPYTENWVCKYGRRLRDVYGYSIQTILE